MVNPYYVGTTLSDIGSNMSRDRGYESQQAIAQMEARQRQFAMMQQAMLERQRMAQQQQQFAQEMAFRGAGQGQDNQYRNAMLALKQQEMQNQTNGFSARDQADNTYRYAALQNALDIEKQRASLQDPRLQVERERQAALTARDLTQAQEAWDYAKVSADTKASQYNALAEQIEKEATEKEKKQSFGFDDPESRKLVADKHRSEKFAELMAMLQSDKRPGDVTPNPITKRFEAVLPPRPGGQQQQNKPLPGLGGGAYQFNPIAPQPQQQAAPTVDANKLVKVRASDGSIWNAPVGALKAMKDRDPGLQILNTNQPPPQPRGATGSWANPLLDGLYNQATTGGYNAY